MGEEIMGWLIIILVLIGLIASFSAKMYDMALFLAIIAFIMIWLKMRKGKDVISGDRK